MKMVINGIFVEGPWNNGFGIVRDTVWATNAVAPAGCGLIFVNLYGGGVCIRRVMLLAERYIYIYTGCNRRKGPDFGRVFLMLNYTEKPQNTYIQS